MDVSDRAGLPVRTHGGLVLASVGLGAALLEPAEVIVQRLQPDPASVIDAMGRNDVHFLIVSAGFAVARDRCMTGHGDERYRP